MHAFHLPEVQDRRAKAANVAVDVELANLRPDHTSAAAAGKFADLGQHPKPCKSPVRLDTIANVLVLVTAVLVVLVAVATVPFEVERDRLAQQSAPARTPSVTLAAR